jgi:hypothetical protein
MLTHLRRDLISNPHPTSIHRLSNIDFARYSTLYFTRLHRLFWLVIGQATIIVDVYVRTSSCFIVTSPINDGNSLRSLLPLFYHCYPILPPVPTIRLENSRSEAVILDWLNDCEKKHQFNMVAERGKRPSNEGKTHQL